MIQNCDGCIEEFYQALEYQKQGLFFATTKYFDYGIETRKHLFIMMVDETGKIIVG